MEITVNLGSRSFDMGIRSYSKEEYEKLKETKSDKDILMEFVNEQDLDSETRVYGGDIIVQDEDFEELDFDESEVKFIEDTHYEYERCKEMKGVCFVYMHEFSPGLTAEIDIEDEYDMSKLELYRLNVPYAWGDLFTGVAYDGEELDFCDDGFDGDGMSGYKIDYTSGEPVITSLA